MREVTDGGIVRVADPDDDEEDEIRETVVVSLPMDNRGIFLKSEEKEEKSRLDDVAKVPRVSDPRMEAEPVRLLFLTESEIIFLPSDRRGVLIVVPEDDDEDEKIPELADALVEVLEGAGVMDMSAEIVDGGITDARIS